MYLVANIFNILPANIFSCVSIIDLEQVNVSWAQQTFTCSKSTIEV